MNIRHWTWTGLGFRRGTVYTALGTYTEAIARITCDNPIHRNDLADPKQFALHSQDAIATPVRIPVRSYQDEYGWHVFPVDPKLGDVFCGMGPSKEAAIDSLREDINATIAAIALFFPGRSPVRYILELEEKAIAPLQKSL
ncbi:MAG: hypothetical protein ACRC62_15725 [Microcoleus sp.]